MLPLAAEGGQGGGTAFILPPLYEIFWAAIVLLLILLVVGRYALPRLYAVLDERAQRIQEGLDLADKAKQDQADAEKREADMRRDFAIDTKLAQMGVRNAKAARAIIPNIADAKLDEQGNLTGIDFDALKKDNAYMFADQPRESAGGDPKGGAGSDGLADFRAAFGLTNESKE